MSKRVLILSASPRKGGNSDTLCDQFALGAQEAGHDVEMIRLRDHHIGYCTAVEFVTAPTAVCKRMIWPIFWIKW